MLAEYETLRNEVLAAIAHRVAVMNFVFAALTVLLAGLLTRNIGDAVAAAVAIFAVPQFAHAGLLIWLGEYRRSQRASLWLSRLEQRINREVEVKAMGWEGRSQDPAATDFKHMAFPYVATVTLLVGVAYAGLAIGGFLLVEWWKGHSDLHLWIPLTGVGVYALVTEAAFLWFFVSRWRECRRRFA
ncbi:MAG: hypothetical protein WD404_04665 [Solirubrobacterales bacterium]